MAGMGFNVVLLIVVSREGGLMSYKTCPKCKEPIRGRHAETCYKLPSPNELLEMYNALDVPVKKRVGVLSRRYDVAYGTMAHRLKVARVAIPDEGKCKRCGMLIFDSLELAREHRDETTGCALDSAHWHVNVDGYCLLCREGV